MLARNHSPIQEKNSLLERLMLLQAEHICGPRLRSPSGSFLIASANGASVGVCVCRSVTQLCMQRHRRSGGGSRPAAEQQAACCAEWVSRVSRMMTAYPTDPTGTTTQQGSCTGAKAVAQTEQEGINERVTHVD